MGGFERATARQRRWLNGPTATDGTTATTTEIRDVYRRQHNCDDGPDSMTTGTAPLRNAQPTNFPSRRRLRAGLPRGLAGSDGVPRARLGGRRACRQRTPPVTVACGASAPVARVVARGASEVGGRASRLGRGRRRFGTVLSGSVPVVMGTPRSVRSFIFRRSHGSPVFDVRELARITQ